LDFRLSGSAETVGCETSSNLVRKLSWYEMTLEDAQEDEAISQSRGDWHRSSGQSPGQVVRWATESEGATSVDRVLSLETDPGGGRGARSTSLAKREW
jgi:hypothetical protein